MKLPVETHWQKQDAAYYLCVGCMVSGMEMATRLYRLIHGTWEAAVMMCQKAQQDFRHSGRLFNKSSTVHTAAQS